MSSDIKEIKQEILPVKEESNKTVQAKTFDECVGKEISHQAHTHPDQEHDQNVAIAHEKCRKRFGISKARVLFLIEKSQLLDLESLEIVKTTMEKNMGSEDWVEFAALLKNEGQKHQQICDRVKKSSSWIKKYVNPMLKQVTPIATLSSFGDTFEPPKPVLPVHTILEFTVSELKKATRTFAGWGSVELKDSQNEVVSIKGLEAIMPTYIKRGAPIIFGHSNRVVGKVLKYQIKDKAVNGKQIPGLWLEGLVYSDYKIDDEAWEALEYAYKTGLPVLSLGATPIGHPQVECDDKACFKKYNEFQLYEFTITEQQKGSIGANPEATVEVTMSKSTEGQELDSKDKQWIGGKLLRMKKSGTLPNDDLELVNLMLATCSTCQDQYNGMLKAGDTEEQAKTKLLKELVDAMSTVEKEIDETKSQTPSSDEESKSSVVTKDGELDMKAFAMEVMKRIDRIEQAVFKQEEEEEEAPPAEEEELDETKADEQPPIKEDVKDSEPALTLSKEMEKQFETWAQKKGMVKVASTPAPGITQGREITKGQGISEKTKVPTKEEMLDAYHNYKDGGPSKLAAKYSK